MYALKIKLGKVTRRVSLNADETSFENLKQTLKRLFTTELTTDSFVVKYKDDENDLITINTDEELKEAFNVQKDKKLVRLLVIVPSAQPEEPECCFGKFIQKARKCAQENGWCNRSGQQQGAPCHWAKRRPLLIGAVLFMLFCKCSFFAFFLLFVGIAACKIMRKVRGGQCGVYNARACRWACPAPSSAPVAAPQPAVNNTTSNTNSASSSLNQSKSGNTKFEQMLASLEDMGFVDRNANIRALVETRGDLTEAVVRLTAQRD
eukprot:TRINITY_DN829_c0_g1_i1.p1 TRINITY_DN829_c0_g1~~TRINITY_DN829_c0_g1_i1.p1  ORF type:complete len:263 (-),score=83.19 TRINITY_DN829_c0_g1_i1:64-852(-)